MIGQLISTAVVKFFANAVTSTVAFTHRSAKSNSRPDQLITVQLTDRSQSSARTVKLDARYSDRDFVARQIASHREAIALYQDKANGSDAQLRVFAQHILPHLQQHLRVLEALMSEKHRHVRR